MKLATKVKLVDAIGGLDKWSHRCHECSLALVRTGILPDVARVARGVCRGVALQHSWVVLGNPYDPRAPIIDGTRWSWTGSTPTLDYYPTGRSHEYIPKGAGSIWDYGKPPLPLGDVIELEAELSPLAQSFLELAAPRGLDRDGWHVLANSPVSGWPAGEILGAMYDDDRLRPLIPIDVVGMVTDRNPEELYR